MSDQLWLAVKDVEAVLTRRKKKAKSTVKIIFEANHAPSRDSIELTAPKPEKLWRTILDALDKKRFVTGRIASDGNKLVCDAIRIRDKKPDRD